MYANGQGVAEDAVEAVRWYRKAIEQGHTGAQGSPDALYASGSMLPKKSPNPSVRYARPRTKVTPGPSGSSDPLYATGRGIAQDDAEAYKWYRKAAEQGHADAQCKLGFVYSSDKCTPQDQAEGTRWYRKAAEQGHADAQVRLGWRYANGQGVAQDEAEAVRWVRNAAEQGNVNAEESLRQFQQDNESRLERLSGKEDAAVRELHPDKECAKDDSADMIEVLNDTKNTAAVGLRLLVFGLPGSGKSSLLGALVQASRLQAAVLKGQIADDTGRLAKLRRRTYTGTFAPTTAAAAIFLHFVPKGRETSPIAITLVNTDGRLAQQYLTDKRVLRSRDSGLVSDLLAADAVILTLEAAGIRETGGGQIP